MPEEKNEKRAVNEPEVIQKEGRQQPEDKTIVLARHVFPPVLPIIPITGHPMFPKMSGPLALEDEALKTMVTEVARSKSRFVGVVLRKDQPEPGTVRKATARDLYGVGVIAEILQLAQAGPNEPLHVLLGALERMRIDEVVQEDPHILARVSYLLETEMAGNDELKAYSMEVVKTIRELIQLNPLRKEELAVLMSRASLNEPGRIADFAAALTTAEGAQLQEILETISIRVRLRKVLVLLKKEIDVSRIQARISKQIEEKISKQQREFFLREQLKAIKKELGLEKEGKEAEIERFEKRLADLKLTEEAAGRVREEIEKIKLLEQASPEFAVSRTYLDWLTILPWGVYTQDNYDLKRAQRILDRDHYGLEDVKDRILEFLAVGIKKGKVSGTILLFVGPPGVGKTSLGQSIARSMGRNFYRFSVGGIRDEAEIKGHRRTYIGALPGKFIQAIKTCRSANPVIMLDEIDKIGASYHGDPASALLEVLDPEQNREFLDHYLDVRFDLSNVMFICTANVPDTIPRPLLDRMETIKLPGYIMQEKLAIARRHLVPRQLAAHGADPGTIRFTAAALREIADGYAREPGVRGMENQIKRIIRKAVRRMVEKGDGGVLIDRRDVASYLGRRTYTDDALYKKPAPGVAMGIAWTSLGGEILYVEATSVEAEKGGFKQTGQLGNVMVESSEIAYTFARSRLDKNPECREFFAKNFIHLHVPAGATPKDGPSAGITMAVALCSLATNQPMKKWFAMTGELSLTGRVMPIGGVKEKTLAVQRAGIADMILPEGNRRDFEELPPALRKGLRPHFVSTFEEAARLVFARPM